MNQQPKDIALYRARALELLDYATDEDQGRSESDLQYKLITEARDTGKAYSSCGDLVHWMLYRLGVREYFVNRAEHLGWKMGRNISLLAWKCAATRRPRKNEKYSAGDILMIWNDAGGKDAHVFVVREHVGDIIYSADYGQPGGARRGRMLRNGFLGNRKLQIVIPLEDIISNARAAGKLITDDEKLLAEDKAEQSTPNPPTRRRNTLRVGDEGQLVKVLQESLNLLIADDDVRLVVDGDFGPKTRGRVRVFQHSVKLIADGVVGSRTWTALEQ